MASTKTSGFSMLELTTVLGISVVLTAVFALSYQPLMQQEHVTDAYNMTMMALRRAHDQAEADMRVYQVTFTGPVAGVNPNGGTITVIQAANALATNLLSVTLPADVTFHIEPGIPTSPTTPPTTPDGFGTAANAIDFNQPPSGTGGGTVVYFYPNGSAQNAGPPAGNVDNGVIYLGMPGTLSSCRAITLWGYTGRIRGWRLSQNGGGWKWVEN
jgi:type II secretory pathway pseudopilin PulG